MRTLDSTPKLETVLAPPDHLRGHERISVDFPIDHDDRHKGMDNVLTAAKGGNESGVLLCGHGPAPKRLRNIGIAVRRSDVDFPRKVGRLLWRIWRGRGR